MTVSILSERRAYAPFGLEGGEDAQPGVNLIIRDSGRTVNIGAKSSVVMQAGERLRISTPGGSQCICVCGVLLRTDSHCEQQTACLLCASQECGGACLLMGSCRF